MTSFKNPPLIEVIFELRWSLNDNNDFNKSQFLIEDLYTQFAKEYPFRENIVEASLPLQLLSGQVTRRFRKAENEFPLLQVGPGIITLNDDKKSYLWEDFIKRADDLVGGFFELHPIDENQMIGPSIAFFDFFKFNFHDGNAYEFIDKFFNISYNQSFLKTKNNPNNLNINFSYETELGQLLVTFLMGKNSEGEDGILLQTRLNSQGVPPNKEKVIGWLESGHRFSSDLFKELTKGELLESFQ